jgi:hypothetical protein
MGEGNSRRRLVVDAGPAIFIAVHPLPGARGKQPSLVWGTFKTWDVKAM